MRWNFYDHHINTLMIGWTFPIISTCNLLHLQSNTISSLLQFTFTSTLLQSTDITLHIRSVSPAISQPCIDNRSDTPSSCSAFNPVAVVDGVLHINFISSACFVNLASTTRLLVFHFAQLLIEEWLQRALSLSFVNLASTTRLLCIPFTQPVSKERHCTPIENVQSAHQIDSALTLSTSSILPFNQRLIGERHCTLIGNIWSTHQNDITSFDQINQAFFTIVNKIASVLKSRVSVFNSYYYLSIYHNEFDELLRHG